MFFRDKKHELFYYNSLTRCQNEDCFHKALFYCLGIDENTRNYVENIYDFASNTIHPEVINEPWQTSSSRQATRLAFNLFSNSCPSLDYDSSFEEQLSECRKYSVSYIFSSPYALYFYEAIKIMYHDCFEKP